MAVLKVFAVELSLWRRGMVCAPVDCESIRIPVLLDPAVPLCLVPVDPSEAKLVNCPFLPVRAPMGVQVVFVSPAVQAAVRFKLTVGIAVLQEVALLSRVDSLKHKGAEEQ